MKRIIKCFYVFFFLTGMIFNLYALEVDFDELKDVKKIKFENYTGEHFEPDTYDEIKDIGKTLAEDVSKKGDKKKFEYYMKYSIIHAVTNDDSGKLSADIFSIDEEARVDHIKNVRRIIAGYLESMYAYSERNANALAVFITYYNAIYRRDMDYFTSKYKEIVLSHINYENAGMSTIFDEWPGDTKIVIPLSEEAKRGMLDAIDPDIISDSKVKDILRQDDENIDDRRDIVKLKKDIIKKDKSELADKISDLKKEKRELDKKTKDVKEEKEIVEKSKADIVKKEKDLKKEKEVIKTIKNPNERKKREKQVKKKEEKIKEEKKEITKVEKKIAKKEKGIDKEKAKIREKDEKIEDKEVRIALREDAVRDEEKEIDTDELDSLTKDEKKVKEKAKDLQEKEKKLDEREDTIKKNPPEKNIYADKLYYLKIREYLDGGHYNNEMYMINAATHKVMFKSPENNIGGNKYDVFSDGVIVITHKESDQRGYRLSVLDRDTLKAKNHGEEDVFWRSFIEVRDDFIYVIISNNQDYYLGKFDKSLKLVDKSKEKINKDTFISFYNDFIYINSWDLKILALKKADLSLIEVIEP